MSQSKKRPRSETESIEPERRSIILLIEAHGAELPDERIPPEETKNVKMLSFAGVGEYGFMNGQDIRADSIASATAETNVLGDTIAAFKRDHPNVDENTELLNRIAKEEDKLHNETWPAGKKKVWIGSI